MRLHLLRAAPIFLALGSNPRDTRCEQIADQIRGMLESCGVTFAHYQDDLGSECTDRVEAIDECLLGCYEKGSCSEYEDPGAPFRSCAAACVAPPLPSG